MAIKADVYAYGVAKDADLGVVPESKAAYWMAEWEAPVSANFITLTGSYPDESSQANTAWKIELRSNGQWRVHAQGVGGWYDRGQYFWGGRGQSPIQFDGLRVSLYSKDETTPLKNIHFRAQENRTWMVAFLPAIDVRIAATQQVPRAGQVVHFAGNQVFGTVQSWQWDFGDGSSATVQTVSHTFAKAGTYDVTLARQSGLPAARQPRAFLGADEPLIPPYGDNWRDTEPIVTEASEAILAAARGASPDNPVWVTALGPISNVACAILESR